MQFATSLRCFVLIAVILLLSHNKKGHCEPLKAIAVGKLPADDRLKPLKDLNGYFPFEVSASKQLWSIRKEQVERRIKVALGLWPNPTKTPLHPVIHGKIDQTDYTVEKVFFQSLPGFYVTGNLYRPKKIKSKVPAVLCPHGHWSQGRFYDDGEANVKNKIEQGAEKDLQGGRSPLQARCVHLARMGCVVFHYDMIGYADSVQLSFELAHRFADQRPEMNTLKNWGLYSTQAEANLQSIMGLQTWNSIRSLDFLETLPEVDPQRIAITGGSGGGTQSMILAAIDPRIAVSFPAVMVSTAMQGGCTCENCSLLRIETGNVEFATLFAPKPQGLTAADDWTVELATKGFPELQQHYAMLGSKENIMLAANTQFKHNYNLPSRLAMYQWFNDHLNLQHKKPIQERPYQRLEMKDLTVWNDNYPQPEIESNFENQLISYLTQDSKTLIDALIPTDQASFKNYQKVVGGAIDILIGRQVPATNQLQYEATAKQPHKKYLEIASLLTLKTKQGKQEQLPLLFLYPHNWNGKAVIWLSDHGKAGLYDKQGDFIPAVQKLVDAGTTVIGVDLFQQGEFLMPEEIVKQTRKVANPREFAGYTFGYNHSLFAHRVHDVLTVISFVAGHELQPEKVDLVGIGNSGVIAAAARAQARGLIDQAAIDTAGFRFQQLTSYRDPMFLPGAAKYHDVSGMLAVAAPHALLLSDKNKNGLEIITAAYQSMAAENRLQLSQSKLQKFSLEAAAWLLQE